MTMANKVRQGLLVGPGVLASKDRQVLLAEMDQMAILAEMEILDLQEEMVILETLVGMALQEELDPQDVPVPLEKAEIPGMMAVQVSQGRMEHQVKKVIQDDQALREKMVTKEIVDARELLDHKVQQVPQALMEPQGPLVALVRTVTTGNLVPLAETVSLVLPAGQVPVGA